MYSNCYQFCHFIYIYLRIDCIIQFQSTPLPSTDSEGYKSGSSTFSGTHLQEEDTSSLSTISNAEDQVESASSLKQQPLPYPRSVTQHIQLFEDLQDSM